MLGQLWSCGSLAAAFVCQVPSNEDLLILSIPEKFSSFQYEPPMLLIQYFGSVQAWWFVMGTTSGSSTFIPNILSVREVKEEATPQGKHPAL